MTEEWAIQVLARTIYGEARGEPIDGRRAVASVILNRAKKSGESIAYECLKRRQFSAWNHGNSNRKVMIDASHKSPGFPACVQIATAAVAGNLPDLTRGATHYFNPTLANPDWAKKMEFTVTIGGHVFYKELT